MVVTAAGGCSLTGKSPLDGNFSKAPTLAGSESVDAFQRMRDAKANQSIVLQVAGDSEPIRVLPLPPDGRAIFVSDLLKQTGVQESMGRMIVTVYRSSPVDYQGAKMLVRFEPDGKSIRPETDYALQSGDRIKVMKDTTSALSSVIEQIFPTNAARAFGSR